MAINLAALDRMTRLAHAANAINLTIAYYEKGLYMSLHAATMWQYLDADIQTLGLDFVLDALTEESKEVIRKTILEQEDTFLACISQAPILAVFKTI